MISKTEAAAMIGITVPELEDKIAHPRYYNQMISACVPATETIGPWYDIFKNDLFIENAGRWYAFTLTPAAHIKTLCYVSMSISAQCARIPEHYDREFTTVSDVAAICVNGILFDNGGEDGDNRVIVRTFKEWPAGPCSKAQVYGAERLSTFRPADGIARVAWSDCQPAGKQVVETDNVFRCEIYYHKLYIFRTEN